MCGIIGILGKSPIVQRLYHGMLQLQHRGQDASGVFLYDPSLNKRTLKKKAGWISPFLIEELPDATWGVGHVRYSTSGKGNIADAQPFCAAWGNATLTMAHNGHLVNYPALREKLNRELKTNCDSEAILALLARELKRDIPFFEALCHAVQVVMEQVKGAYSVIGMVTDFGLFAFRDPSGIRPLLLGRGEDMSAIASETLALSNIGCTSIEDIPPGSVVFIDKEDRLHRRTLVQKKHAHCTFEFNYFAKTHTVMEGKEIYAVRYKLGESLAKHILERKLGALDAIIPIPDTGTPAATAIAHLLKVPFAEGFVKLQNAGRTFITAGHEERLMATFKKFGTNRSVFEGKSVLLVDDSIVRGTVSKRTLSLAKEAGAKRIVFASTFPRILHPCLYGIDFPDPKQLMAVGKSLEEIAKAIGADDVVYNEVEDLKKAVGLDDLCLGCMTGRYPTPKKEMKAQQLLRIRELSYNTAGFSNE